MSTNRLNLTARDYTVAWLLNLLHTQGLISPKQEQDVMRQERVLREKTLRRRVDDGTRRTYPARRRRSATESLRRRRSPR